MTIELYNIFFIVCIGVISYFLKETMNRVKETHLLAVNTRQEQLVMIEKAHAMDQLINQRLSSEIALLSENIKHLTEKINKQ